MEVRVKLEGEDIGQRVKKRVDGLGAVVREAMQETAEEVAEFILFAGAEDIESAGNFGDEWVDALHADITKTQRTVTIDVSMQPEGPPVTYWKVFEYGATIFAHNARGLLTWPNKSAFSINGKVPEFISKASVTIEKKFHLHEIVKEEAAKAREVFRRILDEKRQD